MGTEVLRKLVTACTFCRSIPLATKLVMVDMQNLLVALTQILPLDAKELMDYLGDLPLLQVQNLQMVYL